MCSNSIIAWVVVVWLVHDMYKLISSQNRCENTTGFSKLSKYALRSQTRISEYFQIQVWGEGGKKLQETAQKNKAAGPHSHVLESM